MLIQVPQDLLHETDNLAQTQAGPLPDGNIVPSIGISPSSGVQALQGCGFLKGLNVSLHSVSLCWGPWKRQPGRDGPWAGSRRETLHANSINWRAWRSFQSSLAHGHCQARCLCWKTVHRGRVCGCSMVTGEMDGARWSTGQHCEGGNGRAGIGDSNGGEGLGRK